MPPHENSQAHEERTAFIKILKVPAPAFELLWRDDFTLKCLLLNLIEQEQLPPELIVDSENGGRLDGHSSQVAALPEETRQGPPRIAVVEAALGVALNDPPLNVGLAAVYRQAAPVGIGHNDPAAELW